MADITGAPALADHVLALPVLALLVFSGPCLALVAAPRRALATRFDPFAVAIGQLEFQRAGERIGLGQPEVEHIAHIIGRAAVLAGQRMRALVIGEIFAAQRTHRHQPVAAQLHDGREEAELLHARDAGLESLAHAA